MDNSRKITFDNEKYYPGRYFGKDTHLNDATIYFRNRKDYIKKEVVNLDFAHVQANEDEELIRSFCLF